jgi:hypothetical protein
MHLGRRSDWKKECWLVQGILGSDVYLYHYGFHVPCPMVETWMNCPSNNHACTCSYLPIAYNQNTLEHAVVSLVRTCSGVVLFDFAHIARQKGVDTSERDCLEFLISILPGIDSFSG